MCTRFEDDDGVCLSHLHKNLFTVAALDNIDHNLTSTTVLAKYPCTMCYSGQNRISVSRAFVTTYVYMKLAKRDISGFTSETGNQFNC